MGTADNMEGSFQLENDRPQTPMRKFIESRNNNQKVMFSGMDCLPGQQDLFQTDGGSDEASEDRPSVLVRKEAG